MRRGRRGDGAERDGRRARATIAALFVGVLVAAGAAAAPAAVPARRTTPVAATATISTHDVDRGGVVTFFGTCTPAPPARGDLILVLRVSLVAGQPGAPSTVQRELLLDALGYEADLGLPAEAPAGHYRAEAVCMIGDTTEAARIDAPDLTVEATAVDPGGAASLAGPPSEPQGSLLPFQVSCPASTPRADHYEVTGRASIDGTSRGGNISGPLDASGHATVLLLGPIGGPPGDHSLPPATYQLTLQCLAGPHVLRATVVRPLTITAAPPPTAVPSSTTPAGTAAPAAGNGSAPGATPVVGASRFTG